jgi:hypothetical protein
MTVNDFDVQTRQARGCRQVNAVMGHDECPRYATHIYFLGNLGNPLVYV